MSGHNKWSKIKNKKAVEDKKKSKVFSMLSRVITLESKNANGDQSSPSLRTVIEKARAANMPRDNIDRAVARGVGGGGVALFEVLYEGYGPGGAAIVIPCVTNNTNRTRAEIKTIFSKRGFSLGEPGCATWAFDMREGTYIARDEMVLEDKEKGSLSELIDLLDEHDDVSGVYTNATL